MKGDDFKIPGIKNPMDDPVYRSAVKYLRTLRQGECKIQMDDPVVREILADLAREVTQRDVDALWRSLGVRDLKGVWVRRVTCEHVYHRLPSWPVPGETWEHWLTAVAKCLPVRPVLALLTDAGVLGANWADEDAKNRVFEERGWR